MLSCELPPANEYPDHELPPSTGNPDTEVPPANNNPEPSFSQNIENRQLADDWLSVDSMIWGFNKPEDTSAGDNELQESNTHVSSRLSDPQYKSVIYYYKETSPLIIYDLKVGDDLQDEERKGKTLFKIWIRSDQIPNINSTKEHLKGFKIERKIIQFALKEKNFGLVIPPKGKDHKPQEEPDINFSVEFSLEKGRQWINSFFEAISSMHDLLEYDPYKPALVRFAWEGVNSQGINEIIYSDAYEFSDKDMVIANYNIMRIFNKHNNLLP